MRRLVPVAGDGVGQLQRWLGVELDEVSWRERAASLLGGVVAIAAVIAISRHGFGLEGASMVIASMGASAVLLFAVPHGQLSQPWPVLVGHVMSAAIGVTCAKAIPNVEIAAALAVGLSIAAMHQLRCVHPPGGATALTAVIAPAPLRSMGYLFVLRPVLLNALIIVVVAVAFNAVIPWRRYPAGRAVNRAPALPAEADAPSHADVLHALRSIDSFIDITEEDLLALHRALNAARADPPAGP